MRDALARSGRRTLVAVDFDGTLAPIQTRPERVHVPDEILRTLRRFTNASRPRPRLALVTARPKRDVKRLLPVGGILTVAQYGLESSLGPGAGERARWRRAAREVERLLDPLAVSIPGAWVEFKSMTVALHDRRVPPRRLPELRRLLRRVARRARALGFEPARGKRVTDFVPRGYDKGRVVRLLRERYRPEVIVYFGDSDADEPAFAALGPGDVGIRVGPGPTRARYRVRSPEEVGRFFRELHGLRKGRKREPGGNS